MNDDKIKSMGVPGEMAPQRFNFVTLNLPRRAGGAVRQEAVKVTHTAVVSERVNVVRMTIEPQKRGRKRKNPMLDQGCVSGNDKDSAKNGPYGVDDE